MAAIQLRDVRKSYGSLEVLHGISGQVKDGEFTVVVGPSGCGKSTLLRMIAGLERITSGEVLIADAVVNDLEPADRDIAMVFQNYALYPHMTVFDNMAYGLKIRKVSKEEIKRRVHEVADILEIRDYLKRKPRQLSGGQRQRVAMGRANRQSFFLMNRCRTSMQNCVCRCGLKYASCNSGWESHRSMSRTIKSRQ
jgi:sn-glycerol 3-phosphate transport system ATP-binding protein